MTALVDRNTDVPSVSWSDFKRQFQWQQGEHVTLIGHTGSGKTETLIRLLPYRKYVAVFGTKGRDKTMDQLTRAGYLRLKQWTGDLSNHVVLWPEISGIGPESRKYLRRVFLEAMNSIYNAGGWCLAIDEISFFSDMLGLEGELRFMLQQGRSSGISIIGGTQRPYYIPLSFYSQATHLFFWHESDRRNLERIGEISGHVDNRRIVREVQKLKGPKFEGDTRETLYVNTRTGQILKTMVEL